MSEIDMVKKALADLSAQEKKEAAP